MLECFLNTERDTFSLYRNLSVYFLTSIFTLVVLCMNNIVSFKDGKYFVLKWGLRPTLDLTHEMEFFFIVLMILA